MKPLTIVTIVVLALFGVCLLSCGGCVLGTVNEEVNLRKQIQAGSDKNEAVLDKMWKTIAQKAGITTEAVSQVSTMNEIYEDLVAGREGGALFKSVTENYPNLGQAEVLALYRELMSSVEAERVVFLRQQINLRDLVREREALIARPVPKLILDMFGDTTPFKRKGYPEAEGHPEEYQYVFVTSTRTQEMATSGKEDDIELFKQSD